ncbi:MAG: hypothetical protein JNJ45_11415 [Chthonomonas sp.]|nr:hypothetical protein [Chthonomonas sp.]
MPNFLVTIHHAEDFQSSHVDAAMMQAIDDLNDEMVAANIRRFVGGLQGRDEARAIVASGDEFQVTPGLYLDTKSYAGGLWVLEVASMDEAIEWGKKAAVACRAAVEVRQFH